MKATITDDGRVELVGTIAEMRALTKKLDDYQATVEKHHADLVTAGSQRDQPFIADNHTIAIYLDKVTT